jgi:pimeloyl-ACP methyl ester carboxylesterase
MVAAARPSLRDRVDVVFSFGGHSDFPRVLRFLCTGKEPAMRPDPEAGIATNAAAEVYRKPHDYGVVIILLDLAHRVVPADQVDALRAAILTYLQASHYDLIDRRRAGVAFEDARRMAEALSEPSRTLMRQVNNRDVDTLGVLLEPLVAAEGRDAALSPELSPPPACPVFLIHGTGDTVIPSIETERLERYLRGKTRVRALLSRLITHAELDQDVGVGEIWKLVDFFAALLRA